jgi:phosphoribosylamine--glycine ligase
VVCVVLAAEGYPVKPRKGDVISGVDDALALPGVTVYHAGTRQEGGELQTAGGRVLTVCGRGAKLSDAVATAYQGVDRISWRAMQYRTDIGADTLAKLAGGFKGE